MNHQNRPFILHPRYDTGDLCVVTVNAADYLPDATGAADAAPAIQAALDACKRLGGGTVYLPEGRYALRSYLTIPTAVTLRGEWIDPHREPNRGRGTVLCAWCGEGDPDGAPQITMHPCTGLKNLTVYYPGQRVGQPTPYSPTVRQQGADSITLENVTLVNPWRGVQCGPDGNELHMLKNVYITPVHEGFFMDLTTDIGRMQNLNVGPRYWEEFTLSPADAPMDEETRQTLRDYMLREVTGVFMARSDWEYGYDIHIEHCHIGFTITVFASGGPNAQISRLQLHNCYIGFKLLKLNPFGLALSDSRITADIPGLCAAIVSEESFDTVMQLNGVDIDGCYPRLIQHNGTGFLSLANCTLSGWTDTAVVQQGGGLSLLQCAFGEGRHLTLSEGIGGAQVLGCTFAGGRQFQVAEQAAENLQFSDEPLYLPVAPKGGHKFRTIPARPKADRLFLAADYGVTTDPAHDNTADLQRALDDAGEQGGVVYLPGGWYRFDGTLAVPAGVELRGVFEVPSHTMGGGTVLRTYQGKGDENAVPFITLGEGAGVRGLVIQHPDQDAANPSPYPWAVRSLGRDPYAVDVVFVNSWLGLDFGTNPSEGHYISYIGGAPIRCGIFVGNCAGEGWVENVQYNPHYWGRSNFENKVGSHFREFWHRQIEFLDALRFGYTENEHVLGTFVFAAKHGLHFIKQNGKGAKGTFIGHGTDGGEIGLDIVGCEDIDLINTELVTIESPQTRMYFVTEPGSTGKVRAYNSLMWGNPHYPVMLHGCDVQFQQTNFVDCGKTCITVHGGNQDVVGSYFYKNTDNAAVDGGALRLRASMTPRRPEGRETVLDLTVTGGEAKAEWNWSK